MSDTSYAESAQQPVITGCQTDWHGYRDTDGGRIGYVVITGHHGRILGTVGEIKHDPTTGHYHGRAAAGTYWTQCGNETDVMTSVCELFRASPYHGQVVQVIGEYRRGLLTRPQRDWCIADALNQYALAAADATVATTAHGWIILSVEIV